MMDAGGVNCSFSKGSHTERRERERERERDRERETEGRSRGSLLQPFSSLNTEGSIGDNGDGGEMVLSKA